MEKPSEKDIEKYKKNILSQALGQVDGLLTAFVDKVVVKRTKGGPVLFIGDTEVRSWLGVEHDDEADIIAKSIKMEILTNNSNLCVQKPRINK